MEQIIKYKNFKHKKTKYGLIEIEELKESDYIGLFNIPIIFWAIKQNRKIFGIEDEN